jgi:hypothetical protein
METRPHPTHHSHYHPGRAFWGVLVAVAGVFLGVFIAMVSPGESRVLAVLRFSSLGASALAFVGGALLATVTEIPHRWPRCPSCRRLLWRSRIDYRQSYYPCRRCDVTWTCPCCKAAD